MRAGLRTLSSPMLAIGSIQYGPVLAVFSHSHSRTVAVYACVHVLRFGLHGVCVLFAMMTMSGGLNGSW